MSALVLSFSLLISLVASQTTHTVQVGQDGSFYTPPTISAQLNDTVTFVFAGGRHSVTQGSFDSPCIPLQNGGFNSGLAGPGSNPAGIAPTWDLHITDVSKPIWFFCQSTTPQSHCEQGMTGVINPPSIAMYEQYVAAAKLVTSTPIPTPALTLTGIGAFATNSPLASSTSLSSTSVPSSSSSSATSSSSIPSSTSSLVTSLPTAAVETSQSSFQKHKGGIIAGAVIGGLVVIALFMALFFCLKRQRDKSLIHDFFSYRIPSPQNMTRRDNSQLLLPNSGAGESTNHVAPIIVPLRRESNEYSSTSYARHAYANANPTTEHSIPTYSSDTKSSETYTTSSGMRTNSRKQPPSRQFLDMGQGDTETVSGVDSMSALARDIIGESGLRHSKPDSDGGNDSVTSAPPVYGAL
ncbi:hypothetical protein C8J56DRAFT_880442 [Mycena floridula]|nr:hypothetical protein C8J56DRAFT_880442 [Mycena floridula]